jgi:hypothetical protein
MYYYIVILVALEYVKISLDFLESLIMCCKGKKGFCDPFKAYSKAMEFIYKETNCASSFKLALQVSPWTEA